MTVEEGHIDVGTTSIQLDTTIVVQSTASGARSVHREVIVLGDPETRAAYTKIKNTHAENSDYGIVTRPILPMDSFGRVRVSNPQTIFDSQLQYDENDLVWSEKLTGSGTVTHDANGSFVDMNVTTASGDAVIRQSPHLRYQPGKSQYITLTVDFVEAATNCTKTVGYFDDDNGVFLELDGTTVSFVLRSKVSGTVVNTRVSQSSWNEDVFDGTGRSGVTLDATKSQLVWIDLEWLSVGTVRCGFFHESQPLLAHAFHNANTINKSYMATANLPVRYEITNDAGLSGATKMRQLCSAVMSEGGFSEDYGFPFTAGNGATTIAVTTRRAILSIRPKATFNSIVNRALILPQGYGFFPQTNAGFLEVVYNGVLGGAPSWSSVDDDSMVEFDIAGTTVTGGITFEHAHADAGGIGKNTFSDEKSGDLAARYPLNLDSTGGSPKHLSLVVTSMVVDSTCAVVGHLNWKEIR
ncbi:hypothetical protein LCGC14_1414180 [marine sediment metagenome]|uniref:Uncharacterized protein n=1 Tax=marine sediment metagenome TaxID=412755 RepID=A0A0F9MV14_9ZZZZ